MKVNEKTLRLIQSDYEHSDITRKEICEKYGITGSTLSNYVKAFGFKPRQRRLVYPTQTELCTQCKRTVSVHGARFCPYCGADVRTESMKIQDSLSSILSITNLIPESYRDTFVKTIRDAIRLIGDSTEGENDT